jgi:hypothetical protein
MGFFDIKNRLFRRKIRDLKAELEQAKNTEDYLYDQGAYFANIADMGDVTRQVSGKDSHVPEVIDVIQSFFNRNGFTVEELVLKNAGRAIDRIEIIPSNELLIAMGVVLQGQDYKIIDDGGREKKFNYVTKYCPMSALARATSILFIKKVQSILSVSRARPTKEGNRLISWIPVIIKYLESQVDSRLILTVETFFDEAFEHFYTLDDSNGAKSRSRLQLRLDASEHVDILEDFTVDQLSDLQPSHRKTRHPRRGCLGPGICAGQRDPSG